MKKKSNWLIKIINPSTDIKITIYENGLVYGNEYNEKLFILTNDTVSKIKECINKSLYNLKEDERTRQNKGNCIIKINDTSRKQRNIKVYGWEYEKTIIKFITNKNNYIKQFVN